MRAIRKMVLFVLAVLLVSFLTGCGGGARPEVGKPAPPVELRRLADGEMMRFPEDWRGRAVAASFFSPG